VKGGSKHIAISLTWCSDIIVIRWGSRSPHGKGHF